MASSSSLLLGLTASLVAYRLLALWKARRSISYHPGNFLTFGFGNLFAAFALPPIKWISPGTNFFWDEKHAPFERYGWDIFSSFSIWPGGLQLIVADAAVIKVRPSSSLLPGQSLIRTSQEVSSSRTRFRKPIELYGPVNIFGDNILSSEGEEWKRFKKIVSPAFSERNNRLVWEETIQVLAQLFSDVWENKDRVTIDNTKDLTFPIALFVIGAAGFGRKISWKEEDNCPPGHAMSFKQALHIAAENIVVRAAFPGFIRKLVPSLRKINLAYEELGLYMQDLIRERLDSAEKAEKHDLLSLLVEHSDEDKENPLTDQEVMGNIFLFLVAGHETTAQTLCFAFALLALYPEEQDALYQEIKTFVPDATLPASEVPKVATEDTVLTTGNLAGESKTIPVPKGTRISFSLPGVHHNPRYWPDPLEFKPSRFLDPNWPRDAFVPFSAGHRSCIGRRFFEVEAVATMVMLLSRYKITVKEEPQFAGETWEEKKARVLATRAGATLTSVSVSSRSNGMS
ncbi:614/534 cytochrome P450 [Coprinopsis cinerea okayama7|uniref:614/534 cytochrome P450 n=1 Tax=Coprinopsis cinerea (strain Okayama-7 / 130 / ATCC MYA-4618 / FGSC 9003) TaxID=240176 RepID=A8NQD2_COPC7|nr:614/534 cytochrome P450 [Coprinopsis cinerea okayama7\|eukprot:XP_001835530.2 614/534 cytochrome P450 [Coprinopsis cinerea okayama7\